MSNNVQVKTWVGISRFASADAKTAEANQIPNLFANFVGKAQKTLDIAIYDFRLDPAQGDTVVGALNKLVKNGVTVRVAYFEPPTKTASPVKTRRDGGDSTPGTHAGDLKKLDNKIQRKAIKGIEIADLPKGTKTEPVEGGGHLMHSKYMIRDGNAVWMGSANFTSEAWSVQDNNVVQVISDSLANYYTTDFNDLWASGRIAGSGKDDLGSVKVDEDDL